MAGAVGAVAASVRLRGVGALGRCSFPLLSGTQAPVQSQYCDQKRCIVTKALREPGYKRPAPFPYKEKKYNLTRAFFDDVTQRFDENSKIIVVDGPPTGNKSEFAKQIAEELDMHYIPGANMDAIYITDYGYDLRQLNDKLPFMGQCFDVSDFLRNPKHNHATKLQFDMMIIRFKQYQDAISHLLNTGQGVVMHRSLYSDIVFMETLVDCGFSTSNARSFYYECRQQGMWEFIRPHLVIYLDIPVDQVIKNVKARNRPEELNSPFYTPQVLSTLEKHYKQKYLKDISEHAELLVYDWSEGGDAEVVVEDICRIDFDQYTHYDKKMSDWNFPKEWDWKDKRIMFSTYRHHMVSWLNVPKMTVPEIVMNGEDTLKYNAIIESVPGSYFDFGFNKDKGDSFWFKIKPDVLK